MKLFLGVYLALVLSAAALPPLSAHAQVQGQWTATGSMQSPRIKNVQLPLSGGRVLSVGGVDNNNNVLATAEIYSPGPGTWVSTGALATARAQSAGVVLKTGKILVAGGLSPSGAAIASAELYDPVAGTWSSAGALSVARYAHTATLLSNGKVLVTGGCAASGCASVTPVSEIYNPTTNSWSTTGSLVTAHSGHAAILLKTGKVLILGGYAPGPTADCELYNPATGAWSATSSMHSARAQLGATLLTSGKVLATGGVISKYPMNSAELYDPTTTLWTLTGSMTHGRYAHTSTLLKDGTVLLAGGEGQSISCGKACTGYIPTASVELYNETTGAFTITTSLKRALAYHSTTPTSTGVALTSGGEGYTATCCIVVSDAEYYTPLSLNFSTYSLNFGLLKVGLTSPPQTVTVSNPSDHSSTFTGIAASGDYAQTNTCPATLPPGQQCAISVTFTPTKSGVRAGALTVKDNDPGSPTQTVTLTGTGEVLSLGFTPTSLNLGSVPVGSSSTQSATLINDGSAPVSITGITVSPSNGTFTETNNCPASLAVQQSCTVQVVFTPPDVFNYSATVSVTNNAGAAATLPVSGTGLDGGG
jgi:hypothetical protein